MALAGHTAEKITRRISKGCLASKKQKKDLINCTSQEKKLQLLARLSYYNMEIKEAVIYLYTDILIHKHLHRYLHTYIHIYLNTHQIYSNIFKHFVILSNYFIYLQIESIHPGDSLCESLLVTIDHPHWYTSHHLRMDVVSFLVKYCQVVMIPLKQMLQARGISYYTLCRRTHPWRVGRFGSAHLYKVWLETNHNCY